MCNHKYNTLCKLGNIEAKKYITYTFIYFSSSSSYCFLILDSIASNPRASGVVKYNSSNSWSDNNVILGASGTTNLYITCKRPCWFSRSTSSYNQAPSMQAYQYNAANTTVITGANYGNAVYTTLCFEK